MGGDPGLAGVRALVVEHDPRTALRLSTILGQAGCEIAGVANRLADALRLGKTGKPDLVVMNVDLQQGMGLPRAAALRGTEVRFAFVRRRPLSTGETAARPADPPRPPQPAAVPSSPSPVVGWARFRTAQDAFVENRARFEQLRTDYELAKTHHRSRTSDLGFHITRARSIQRRTPSIVPGSRPGINKQPDLV